MEKQLYDSSGLSRPSEPYSSARRLLRRAIHFFSYHLILTRRTTRRARAAALGAGGTERHAPRHWPEYRAYCAFVSDPDGNNIEAVHKEAQTTSSARVC